MLKNSNTIALVCGVTLVIATTIFYLLIFDNIFTIPMRWVSLMFLIIAEIIGTVKAISIKKSIFGVTNIIISIFHLGVVLALSIIFVNAFPLLVKRYILLNLLGIGFMFAIDMIIIHFGGYIGDKNKALAGSHAVINGLYTKAESLAMEYKQSNYSKDLDEISEMLKFSDISTLSNDEIAILDQLEELHKLLSADGEGISQKMSDIKESIKLRSLKIQDIKRGSY